MTVDTQVTLLEDILSVPAPINEGGMDGEGGETLRSNSGEVRSTSPRPFTRYNGHICTNEWKSDEIKKKERKRRRIYQRLLTGLYYHRGKTLRFLTLTLVRGSDNDIHRCFRVFKERIRRLTPNKLMKQDLEKFFTPQKMNQYFGNSDTYNKRIKFEYFSVNVAEDRQHMHVLYFGDWLPHAWIKKVWKEITEDSEVVDIRVVNNGVYDVKSLASYVLAQYTIYQGGDIRFQMSHGWTWRGSARDWKRAKKRHSKVKNGRYEINFPELFADWTHIVNEMRIPQMNL
jgi:hypothetical protein